MKESKEMNGQDLEMKTVQMLVTGRKYGRTIFKCHSDAMEFLKKQKAQGEKYLWDTRCYDEGKYKLFVWKIPALVKIPKKGLQYIGDFDANFATPGRVELSKVENYQA